jgi:hypothetical protein
VRLEGGLGLAILIALATWGGIEVDGTQARRHPVEKLKTARTADVPASSSNSGYRRWADVDCGEMVAEHRASEAAIVSTPASPCCPSILAGRLSFQRRLLAPTDRDADPREALADRIEATPRPVG